MDIAPIALIGALIYTLINLVRYVLGGDFNGAITIVTGFVIGIVVVMLVSQASITNGFTFNGQTLSDLDLWSKIIIGLLATSLFSVVNDLKKAFDGTDSARVPSLTSLASTRNEVNPPAG
jgi:hypothetical protein